MCASVRANNALDRYCRHDLGVSRRGANRDRILEVALVRFVGCALMWMALHWRDIATALCISAIIALWLLWPWVIR